MILHIIRGCRFILYFSFQLRVNGKLHTSLNSSNNQLSPQLVIILLAIVLKRTISIMETKSKQERQL